MTSLSKKIVNQFFQLLKKIQITWFNFKENYFVLKE